MMKPIRIQNGEDGSTNSMVVTLEGQKIEGITRINLAEMLPGQRLTAEITVCAVRVDVHAHPLLSLSSLIEAADMYGYKLVSKYVG